MPQCENFYRQAFYQALVGMVQISEDDVIQAANPAFCQSLGYKEESELQGVHCSDIIYSKDIPVLRRLYKAMADHQQLCQVALRYRRCDGTLLWSTVNISLLSSRDGGTDSYLFQVVGIEDEPLALSAQGEELDTQWGVGISSLDGQHLEEVNPAFAKMYGYTMEELIGQPVIALIPTEYRDHMMLMMAEAQQKGHLSLESVHQRKDGSTFPVAVDITVVREPDSQQRRSILNVQNITPRKELEQSLQHFAAIVTSTNDAIIGKTLDGVVTCWNPGAEALFGYSAAEMVGERIECLIPKFFWEEEQLILDKIRNNETVRNYSTARRHKDGHLIDISITISPIHGGDGETIGVASISRDITELKRMEEELLYRENKFRTLAENSPNIIVRYNRNCQRVYANPAFIREMGVPPELALNSTLEEMWSSAVGLSALECKTLLKQVMETGESKEFILQWPQPGSDKVNIYNFQVTAERKQNGKMAGVLAIGHNITALKEAEKELAESHARLRGLTAQLETIREEERRHIARDLHDELGQNLTALRMGVSMLRLQYGTVDPAFKEQLHGLSGLVDKTILVVRNIATSLRPAPLDMGIRAALEWLVEEFAKRSGVICHLEMDEGEIDVGDKYATAIFRIVQESLTNVARHAQATQVVIRFQHSDSHFLVEVTDDGKGFDVQATGHNSFGLLGIYERAIMMDGEAQIISEPNRGAKVRVTLPIPQTPQKQRGAHV